MFKISRHLFVLVLLVASAVGAPVVRAQEIPPLSDRVVDTAGILPANVKSRLVAQLAAFEAKASDQIVVATIASTGEWTIEQYANLMFRRWGLGQAEENNGVLLLVSVNDRKLRIEVGYGLEGVLTDALSKVIIDSTIVPAFRAGDYPAGIEAGVNDIVAVLEGNAAELEARAERNAVSSVAYDVIRFGFFAVFIFIFVGAFGFALLAPIFGRKLGAGRYKWLGVEIIYGGSSSSSRRGSSGWSSGSSGGFSGGGGSSGGGGASGGW